MGSYAITTGTVYVRDCAEVRAILEELESFTEHMDEQRIEREEAKEHGSEVLRVEIYIAGQCSASTATHIDDTIRRLGDFTVTGAKFETEWEAEKGRFFVGNGEQVAEAASKDARARILELLPFLQGDDINAVLYSAIKDTRMPKFKHEYLNSGGAICPFCGAEKLNSGSVEADGMMGWAAVTCRGCGCSWQDVYVVIDMTEIRDRKEVAGEDRSKPTGE